MPRFIIFANGPLADPARARRLVGPADVILCADGGTRHALTLGLRPELIIGDLDSITPADRRSVEAAGVPVRAHPQDKNETDLELALREAVARGARSICILGALGRRLDHTIANIALLTDPALASLDVRLDDGQEEVFFCRGEAEIEGEAGEIVSLIPWGAEAHGVRTEGLKWPLNGEILSPQRTRGVSNEMLAVTARVHVQSGLLLIIHRRQTQAQERAAAKEGNE